MSVEVFTVFTKKIQDLLRNGKTDSATAVFSDVKYAKAIQDSSWDLIPVLTEHLSRKTQLNHNEVFKCAEHLLNIISEQSNAEEALLQFISEIEEAKDDVNFVVLLNPLFKVILRVPPKKVNSLAWSFNAIQSYVTKCEIPEYTNFENKERLLVDNSESVRRIVRLYSEISVFYDKVFDKLPQTKEATRVLCKFLIQLLGKPLCYLNMENFGNLKSEASCLAENICGKVLKTISDLFIVTEMRHDNERNELVKPDDLSLANLFYLVYTEGVFFETLPKVYDSVYIFVNLLPLSTVLLKEDNLIAVEKGLKFSQNILTSMKNRNLSYVLLDSEDHSRFCKVLTNIIIYHSFETLRKTGLEIFDNYLALFEIRAVYLIILNLMSILDHSGLIGYVITFYKNLLSKEFAINEQNLLEYFRGYRLFRLLRKFCYLKDNEETDLMKNSDQIISTLNFLRYLAIRDKNNVTEIWDFFPVLRDTFLEPLRKGIDLSRAHYELKIKEIMEEHLTKNKDNSDFNSKVSITVLGGCLEEMSREEKIKVLNSSLTAFDVMDSILSRVIECIQNHMN